MFIMPTPTQQSVVTVNYTQLAVLGAEFVGRTISLLRGTGVEVFDVSAKAEEKHRPRRSSAPTSTSRG